MHLAAKKVMAMGKLSSTKWSKVKESFGLDNPKFVHENENGAAKGSVVDGPLRILEVAEKGNTGEFLRILSADPSKLSVCDSNGFTAAHHAAMNDHARILSIIQEYKGSSQFGELDVDGNSPLHIAANSDAVDCIDFLLQNGADTSLLNKNLQSPLHVAAENGRVESLKAMSGHLHMLDVHLPGERGRTPLHLACIHNQFECVKILIEKLHASPHRPCTHSFLPVHEAVKNVSEMALENLLKSGEKCGCSRTQMMNLPDGEGNLPLHFAVQCGDIRMVRACVESGSKISAVRKDLTTAVHLACAQGSTEMVKLMFALQREEHDQSLKSCDLEQMTPLHYAAMFGHTDLVKFLANQESNLNALDKNYCTPLHLSASKNAWRTAKYLILVGADVRIQDKYGRTVLHSIVKHNGDLNKIVDEEVAMSLVPILNTQDKNGNTALHIATTNGQIKSASVLLKLGASIIVKNVDGDNILHVSCRFGRTQIIQMVANHIKFSIVLNESNRNGWTPLHVAAHEGQIKVLEELTKNGAFLRKDYEGRTPLHLAAANGHKEVVNLILKTHSHLIDVPDKNGDTPLHTATIKNQPKVAELLLRRNCQLTYNKEGYSAIDLALMNKLVEAAYVMAAHKNRADEVLSLTEGKHPSIMEALIAEMPAVAKAVLDAGIKKCTTENLDSPNYHVEYSFKWLNKPESSKGEQSSYNYLPILNEMVNYERSSLLSHELSLKYLEMKWNSYGKYFQFANLVSYLIYLCMVTSIATSDLIKDFNFFLRLSWYNDEKNVTDEDSEYLDLTSFDDVDKWNAYVSYLEENQLETALQVLPVICHLVAIFTVINILMEVINIWRHGVKYCQNIDTWVWIAMSTSVLIASYFQLVGYYFPGGLYWDLVCPSMAIACFMGWYYVLLIMQRFDAVGLYVSMFLEILKTLLRVLVVFSVLIIAFALAFYVILANGNHVAYSNIPMAILQTLLMVMGETDFTGTFLHPYICEEMDRRNETDSRLYSTVEECEYPRRIPHSYITFTVVIIFMVFMPIVMLNLLLGLAVGDIELVKKHALLKRLSMQVQIHTNIEKSLPKFLLRKMEKDSILEYPNVKKTSIIDEVAKLFAQEETKDEEEEMNMESDCMVETIQDNNVTLDKLTSDMENMKSMMQLICKKMNISSDVNADEALLADEINPLPDMRQNSHKDGQLIRQRPKLYWSYSNDSTGSA